jgi:hypothetical protein
VGPRCDIRPARRAASRGERRPARRRPACGGKRLRPSAQEPQVAIRDDLLPLLPAVEVGDQAAGVHLARLGVAHIPKFVHRALAAVGRDRLKAVERAHVEPPVLERDVRSGQAERFAALVIVEVHHEDPALAGPGAAVPADERGRRTLADVRVAHDPHVAAELRHPGPAGERVARAGG